jgi:hypothetical protein
MCPQLKNKVLVVSLALAVAGILTCAGALFDVFMPRGSAMAFLGEMVLLGLVACGLVIAFTWLCDKWESHVDDRLERLAGRQPQGSGDRPAGKSPSGASKLVQSVRFPGRGATATPNPGRPRGSHGAAMAMTTWRGQ